MSKTTGRPRIGKTKGVRFEPALWEELYEMAAINGETVSATLRRATRIGLASLRTHAVMHGADLSIGGSHGA